MPYNVVYQLGEAQCQDLDYALQREWLLTNGIGGYAMGTVVGINTRRYHALLTAATQPPTGRMVLLPSVEAYVEGSGTTDGISANQYPGAIHPYGHKYLREFRVDSQSACWKYRVGANVVEKKLALHPGENAATLAYTNTGKNAFRLTLRPLICHKPYHENFTEASGNYPEKLDFPRNYSIVEQDGVPLVLRHDGGQRMPVQGWYYRFEHRKEIERGLDPRDDLFCPCEILYEVAPGETVYLVASLSEGTEPYRPEISNREFDVREALVQASEKFMVRTEKRHSILAGFPWFTDWGRDTMISLPGICLHTGRIKEARQILSDYGSQMRDGLIPNRFVESDELPDYNTVDATLWFANAIYLTLEKEWNEAFARSSLERLDEVFEKHVWGTVFGIGVDPEDGLLTQGEPGVQLTWMDAKVGDWVITPRYGKPVEINGLWINALRATEWIAEKLEPGSGEKYRVVAEKAEENFEKMFWHEVRGHYLDTVHPTDASLRPNQLIAMSLPFAPARGERAVRALEVVTRELLTPYGLRTLGPEEPHYHGRFEGPMPELDAAYHQGTVWPWLIGPYVSALLKLTGDRERAREILNQAGEMLTHAGLGGVSECYDGDAPQHPGGCPWQAWSVAELLRAWDEVERS